MCVCVCACVYLYPRSLSFPSAPPHLSTCCSFLRSIPPLCLSHFIPTIIPPSIRSLPLSLSLPHSLFSAPVTEKQTHSVFLCCLPAHYSPQAATPSQRKGRDKLQEYTCAWCECQIQSQWQPIPGQIMESANLSFRQINLTALSHTPNFKARYEPHYQMRKAIGKKKKKKKNGRKMSRPPQWRSRGITFTKLIYRWNRWEKIRNIFSFQQQSAAKSALTKGI